VNRKCQESIRSIRASVQNFGMNIRATGIILMLALHPGTNQELSRKASSLHRALPT
jgi:hypothetical protein